MMAARAWRKFVEDNKLCRDFKLYDTFVIIDGASLLQYLFAYRLFCGINYGGDYDVYATSIKKYFSCLKRCNIKAIVIFDGGNYESSHLQNPIETQKFEVENVKKFLACKPRITENLPINAFEVFKNILSEMGILYAQCDYEGNKQMACLAAHYCCPILSENIDFYIYDLPYGLIRINDITGISYDGFRKEYISCKIYRLQTFLSVFNIQDRNVLPLFATLSLTNYATIYERFIFREISHSLFQWTPGISFSGQFQITIAWFQNKTLDEAKSSILELVENDKKEKIKYIIENSIEDYKLKPVDISNILSSTSSNEHEVLIDKTKLIASCGAVLPIYIVVAFLKGQLPINLLDIISLQQNEFPPQLGYFLPICKSYIISRHIRHVIYGILLQHDSVDAKKHAEACLRRKELVRNGGNVEKTSVEFLCNLRNGEPVLKLSDIPKKNKDQLREFIENVMEVKKDFISDIPNDLQLYFICINYWLSKSSPKPPIESLPALIFCVIYFQAKEILLQEPRAAIYSRTFISLPAANLVLKNSEKYFQNLSNGVNAKIVKSFDLLQACISDCNALNSLVRVPFEPPKLHKLFNGTLLCNLTKDLQSRLDVKSFTRSFLGTEASEIFFKFLKKFVDVNPLYLAYVN